MCPMLKDRDHTFINYVYSRQILEGIMHKLQINLGTSFDINSTLDTLCNKQNNNSLFNHIINMTFTSMIQHIWCERNSRIFKGIEMPAQIRNTLISQDCKILIQNKLDSNKISRELELILWNFDVRNSTSQDLRPPLVLVRQ